MTTPALPSAYEQAVLRARSLQGAVEAQATARIAQAMEQFADEIGAGLASLSPAARLRAEASQTVVRQAAARLRTRLTKAIEESRSVLFSEVQDVAQQAARSIANASRVPGALAGAIANPPVSMLGWYESLGAAQTWETLLNRHVTAAALEADSVVRRALVEGVSAPELARRLRKYVAGSESFQSAFEGTKLDLRTLPVAQRQAARTMVLNAERIAFTELQNARGEAEVQIFRADPLVRAVKWTLSPNRGTQRTPDACNVLATTDYYGLGHGVYPVDKVPPSPHPWCRCERMPVMRPVKDARKKKPSPPLSASPTYGTLAGATPEVVLRAVAQADARVAWASKGVGAATGPTLTPAGLAQAGLTTAAHEAALASAVPAPAGTATQVKAAQKAVAADAKAAKEAVKAPGKPQDAPKAPTPTPEPPTPPAPVVEAPAADTIEQALAKDVVAQAPLDLAPGQVGTVIEVEGLEVSQIHGLYGTNLTPGYHGGKRLWAVQPKGMQLQAPPLKFFADSYDEVVARVRTLRLAVEKSMDEALRLVYLEKPRAVADLWYQGARVQVRVYATPTTRKVVMSRISPGGTPGNWKVATESSVLTDAAYVGAEGSLPKAVAQEIAKGALVRDAGKVSDLFVGHQAPGNALTTQAPLVDPQGYWESIVVRGGADPGEWKVTLWRKSGGFEGGPVSVSFTSEGAIPATWDPTTLLPDSGAKLQAQIVKAIQEQLANNAAAMAQALGTHVVAPVHPAIQAAIKPGTMPPVIPAHQAEAITARARGRPAARTRVPTGPEAERRMAAMDEQVRARGHLPKEQEEMAAFVERGRKGFGYQLGGATRHRQAIEFERRELFKATLERRGVPAADADRLASLMDAWIDDWVGSSSAQGGALMKHAAEVSYKLQTIYHRGVVLDADPEKIAAFRKDVAALLKKFGVTEKQVIMALETEREILLAQFRRAGIKTVRLYRSVSPSEFTAQGVPVPELGHTGKVVTNSATSWTTDPDLALNWGGKIVLEADVPIENLLAGAVNRSRFYESEFIVAGRPIRVRIVKTLDETTGRTKSVGLAPLQESARQFWSGDHLKVAG